MANAKLLLLGARVFRFGQDHDLPPLADVLVDSGRILAIGQREQLGHAAHGAQEIDLSGCLLLPGFVNAHYHSHDVLAKGCFEATPLEQWSLVSGPLANRRSLAEIRIRTLIGAIEALRNGVTTVQDFCSFEPLDDGVVDAILDGYEEAGIRVVFSITARDRSQLDTIPWARELVPAHLRPVVGESAHDAAMQLEFIERQIERVGDRNGMVIWALSPSAPQRCSPELLRGLAEIASRRKLPVYTHVYETRAQRQFAALSFQRYGGSLIDYMESVGLLGPHVSIAHGVWPDHSEMEKLARTGAAVVLNMLSNLRLKSGVAPIQAYRSLGVALALGCDNCSCSDTQNMFQVMKLYCLLGGIMDPGPQTPTAVESLRLATLGGARTAGKADKLGAIEPGMCADLIALDLSDPAFRPLNSVVRQVVYSETGRSVRHVWVNGSQVVRDGKSSHVDETALVTELAALMPNVSRDIARLRAGAEPLQSCFAEIQRRAWAIPVGFNRFLRDFDVQ